MLGEPLPWSLDPSLRPLVPICAAYFVAAFALRRGGPREERANVSLLLRPLLFGFAAWALVPPWLRSHDTLPSVIVVALGHAAGAWVCRRWTGAAVFVVTQALVVASIVATGPRSAGASLPLSTEGALVLTLAGAYCAVVVAGGEFVARFVRPYLDELDRLREGAEARLLPARRGLAHAGRVIGQLERALVLLLLLLGQPASIGFLVAAKSIFRFGELRDTTNRMESEYIIIGTLASFAYALAVGCLAAAAVAAVAS